MRGGTREKEEVNAPLPICREGPAGPQTFDTALFPDWPARLPQVANDSADRPGDRKDALASVDELYDDSRVGDVMDEFWDEADAFVFSGERETAERDD